MQPKNSGFFCSTVGSSVQTNNTWENVFSDLENPRLY